MSWKNDPHGQQDSVMESHRNSTCTYDACKRQDSHDKVLQTAQTITLNL